MARPMKNPARLKCVPAWILPPAATHEVEIYLVVLFYGDTKTTAVTNHTRPAGLGVVYVTVEQFESKSFTAMNQTINSGVLPSY